MNINPNVLDPKGREIFAFGGDTAWRTTTYRGFIVTLEWFVGNRSTEPILMIQDAKQGHDHGAFGICLSSIGVYADQSGGPSDGALAACKRALPILGRSEIDIEAKALLDLILNFTPALINMPPAPVSVRKAEMGAPMIEVELSDEFTGKVQQEVSV